MGPTLFIEWLTSIKLLTVHITMPLELTPGLVQAISSFLLAIFTIVLAGATWLYYRQTKLQTDEMRKSRELRHEPNMQAGLTTSGPNFELGFANIGGGIAHDVQADYWIEGLEEHKREWGTSIHFPEDIYRIGIPLDDSPIGVIGMSEQIESHLIDGQDTLFVEWIYKDSRGEEYEESQQLDLLGAIKERSESTEFYSGTERDVKF